MKKIIETIPKQNSVQSSVISITIVAAMNFPITIFVMLIGEVYNSCSVEDGTKEYKIICDEKIDIRREIFGKCAKEQMTIFELKNYICYAYW